ncbi:MAG TPA: sulfite reductase, partial [Pseudomonadales bacterium]|nr:sulfite reductase [Pseudomonadales bacterium]
WHHTLFIENGRIIDDEALQLMTGLREIARVHHGEFRVTPNQNLVIANVAEAEKAQMDALLERHGLDRNNRASTIRLNAMSCVGLPTCGLSMAESERYLPQLVSKIEPLLERHGLGGVPITLRMTGCPNGCARPYIAEIAFTGRALGRYNMYLGGGHHGQRLNRLYRENINEAQILEELDRLFAHYARDRHDGEHFGDFVIRAGHVRAVAHGSESYDP